jgi:A/G-specific adenine glycosylase
MDCGAWIKKDVGNISRKSSSYRTQSRFEGSDRQIRGRILRLFTDSAQLSEQEIHEAINEDRDRVQRILTSLCKEGFMVAESAHRYTLTPDH